MGAVSSAAGAVGDVVEDVGSTVDDIVVQPAVSVVEGSIDLSKNSLQTAANAGQQLAQGDIQGAYDETSKGLSNAEDVLSNTWLEIRDPWQAAAVIGGNFLLPGSSIITSKLVSDEAQALLNTNGGQIANAGAGGYGAYSGNMANWTGGPSDPNAVGGTTGPDNIDVGGGFNPSTGATQAELEAAQAAASQQAGTEVTANQITNEIASTSSPAGLSSADKQALYSNAGYGDTMTSAQISAFDKAIASGMTVSGALNVARGALLVNALTGDPLGLSGSGGSSGGGGGSTGFAQVPIPAEWTYPTYSYSPVKNVTFEDLFPGVSLQGTQWQGLQNAQPNMTFNDIFASGMQQTPMGTPVDINQIVSSIVGQNSKI